MFLFLTYATIIATAVTMKTRWASPIIANMLESSMLERFSRPMLCSIGVGVLGALQLAQVALFEFAWQTPVDFDLATRKIQGFVHAVGAICLYAIFERWHRISRNIDNLMTVVNSEPTITPPPSHRSGNQTAARPKGRAA